MRRGEIMLTCGQCPAAEVGPTCVCYVDELTYPPGHECHICKEDVERNLERARQEITRLQNDIAYQRNRYLALVKWLIKEGGECSLQ